MSDSIIGAHRFLARISKMPVQNSNFKNSACPDLATNLLQILIPATSNSLVCQKGQFTLQLCPRRWFVRKIFGNYTQKVKIKNKIIEHFACPNSFFLGNYLSKRQVGQVPAKSLGAPQAYINHRKNIVYGRYLFNMCSQQPKNK